MTNDSRIAYGSYPNLGRKMPKVSRYFSSPLPLGAVSGWPSLRGRWLCYELDMLLGDSIVEEGQESDTEGGVASMSLL